MNMAAKQKGLDEKAFGELLASVRDGGEILRGHRKPSRSFTVEASRVRAIRERTSLSQSEFATLIGVSVKTLQNWERPRRYCKSSRMSRGWPWRRYIGDSAVPRSQRLNG